MTTWTVPGDQSDVESADVEAIATVRSELADSHQGAASDDSLPVAIVVVILVLIVVGVVAGILGFRSTRRRTEDSEERRQGRPLP